MSARELPARPNLEQYKKQAKDLIKAFRSGDNSALQRVREHHPHAARDSFALADAKLVIAREHGGDSWPKFKQQIESASDRVPAAAWKTAEDAIVAGDVATLERILRDYGDMMRKQRPQSSWNNTIQRRAADARSCTPVWQNGRPEAAEYLVTRGAALDFASAAALGRLDVVRTYFSAEGQPSVTNAQMESALVSASFNDATTVVQFLLDRGVDVDAQAGGFSGVNAAATGGRLDTVRLFLSRGASLETKTQYGGTSLSGALWGALNTPENGDYMAVIDALLAAGARIEPGMTGWWKKEASSAPAYARILELLEDRSHES